MRAVEVLGEQVRQRGKVNARQRSKIGVVVAMLLAMDFDHLTPQVRLLATDRHGLNGAPPARRQLA